MSAESELLTAVDQLEELLRLSSSIGDNTFLEDRKAALQIRREITEQNARIMSLAGTASSSEAWRSGFLKQASSLRTEVSSHLSEWPISSVEVSDPRYLASLGRLRLA